MAVLDQLLQIFAASVFAKVNALKALELTPNQRKRLRWTITVEIRACGGLLYPVLEILKTRLRIAWILKREDQELTRLGFRSKRPDPEGAYRAAKIVLVRTLGIAAEPIHGQSSQRPDVDGNENS